MAKIQKAHLNEWLTSHTRVRYRGEYYRVAKVNRTYFLSPDEQATQAAIPFYHLGKGNYGLETNRHNH